MVNTARVLPEVITSLLPFFFYRSWLLFCMVRCKILEVLFALSTNQGIWEYIITSIPQFYESRWTLKCRKSGVFSFSPNTLIKKEVSRYLCRAQVLLLNVNILGLRKGRPGRRTGIFFVYIRLRDYSRRIDLSVLFFLIHHLISVGEQNEGGLLLSIYAALV